MPTGLLVTGAEATARTPSMFHSQMDQSMSLYARRPRTATAPCPRLARRKLGVMERQLRICQNRHPPSSVEERRAPGVRTANQDPGHARYAQIDLFRSAIRALRANDRFIFTLQPRRDAPVRVKWASGAPTAAAHQPHGRRASQIAPLGGKNAHCGNMRHPDAFRRRER